MSLITKNISTGDSLHHFSNDLVWACRYHAKNVTSTGNVHAVRMQSIGAVLAAGSFVEAKLNETSATVINLGSSDAPFEFWQILHEKRKALSYIDKWNLIASLHSGQLWDLSKEPFQAYDLVASLRNELVHYKGEFGDGANFPVKKLNSLRQKLKLGSDSSIGDSWVNEVLCSKLLAPWIEVIVTELDMRFDHLLSGKDFTEMDRTIYHMKQASYASRFVDAT